MYKHLIDHITLQPYLSKPIYCQYKKLICKLRLSSHCLCIETGRYKNVPLERCICPICKSDVEDEYHFMLKCPAYNNLRKRYLKPYYFQRPSVYKLTQLLSTGNVKCKIQKKYVMLVNLLNLLSRKEKLCKTLWFK